MTKIDTRNLNRRQLIKALRGVEKERDELYSSRDAYYRTVGEITRKNEELTGKLNASEFMREECRNDLRWTRGVLDRFKAALEERHIQLANIHNAASDCSEALTEQDVDSRYLVGFLVASCHIHAKKQDVPLTGRAPSDGECARPTETKSFGEPGATGKVRVGDKTYEFEVV